ncbi:hypothetical protein [Granulosicoccus antarcticus]|uniref:hypothetical protein n=1 Tax=Granulosicoccus antarcticus TaxID=437505 RepID=UPI0012FD37D7|nr:hypothetical protein [Granulosicoccus antarcticus]
MNSNTALDNLRNGSTTAQTLLGEDNHPTTLNELTNREYSASNDELADLQSDAGSLNATTMELGASGGFVAQTLQSVLKAIRGEQGESTPVIPANAQAVSVNGNDYQIGAMPPPDINHDNGFLQNPADASDPVPISTRPPTGSERAYYLKEVALAKGGNIVSAIPGAGIFTSKADLDEAIDAYSHFLTGGGETYDVDYGNYLTDDVNGRTTNDSIVQDIQAAGDQLFANEVADGAIKLDDIAVGERIVFTVSGDAIAVGGGAPDNPNSQRFPYPESENWQKAIGAHQVYTRSEVTVTRLENGTLLASAAIEVNFEDRYNFNPGQQDIATGAPDSERGVLEQTGLAQQFDQVGQAQLETQWIIGSPDEAYVAPSNGSSR